MVPATDEKRVRGIARRKETGNDDISQQAERA
jgi:hypothetical protein